MKNKANPNKVIEENWDVLKRHLELMKSRIERHPIFSNWDFISQDFLLGPDFLRKVAQYPYLYINTYSTESKEMLVFMEKQLKLTRVETEQLAAICLIDKFIPPKSWNIKEELDFSCENFCNDIFLVTSVLTKEDIAVFLSVPIASIISREILKSA